MSHDIGELHDPEGYRQEPPKDVGPKREADGSLHSVAWNGAPFGAGHPTGSVTTITGTNVTGVNWASNGMFVFGS